MVCYNYMVHKIWYTISIWYIKYGILLVYHYYYYGIICMQEVQLFLTGDISRRDIPQTLHRQ